MQKGKDRKALYGLIGFPVKHSFSPAMHNAAFRAQGINAEYRLFEVPPEDLQDFLLKRKEVEGFNITIPHKIKAKEILEEKFPLDVNSALIQPQQYYVILSGAINTVKRKADRLEYWNTDAEGFLKSLEEDLNFNTKHKNILLIGCGGAGRAVISALSWKQAEVKKLYIYDISDKAIEATKRHFLSLPSECRDIFERKIEFISKSQIPEIIGECQMLVNASPVGMKKTDPSLVDKDLLHKDLFVYDVVYNRDTQLLKDARQKCEKSCGGLGMLLYQGVSAWELWMNQKAPVKEMRKALEEELNPDSNRDFAK